MKTQSEIANALYANCKKWNFDDNDILLCMDRLKKFYAFFGQSDDVLSHPFMVEYVKTLLPDSSSNTIRNSMKFEDEIDCSEPEWFCEKLNMSYGTLNVCAAEASSSKSALSLTLSTLSAYGLDFLGTPLDTTNSLYFHFDCGVANLKQTRIKYDNYYKQHQKINNSKFIAYTNNSSLVLSSPVGMQFFEDTIKYAVENNNVRFITVDSLFAAAGSDVDVYSPNLRVKVLDPIRKIAEKFNVCILVIHHFNKSDEISGSQTIKDAADNIFSMALDRKDLKVNIKNLKTRNGLDFDKMEFDYYLRQDKSNFDVQYYIENCDEMSKPTVSLKSSEIEIVNLIKKIPGKTAIQYSQILKKDKSNVCRTIRDLVDNNILKKENDNIFTV